MVRTAIFAAMALAFAPLAAHAQAGALAEKQVLVVRYDDLNLASDRGVAEFDRRITHAAEVICGSADIRDLSSSRLVRTCKAQAIRGASEARQLAIAANLTRMAAR